MVNDFHYSNCDLHKRSFIVFTRGEMAELASQEETGEVEEDHDDDDNTDHTHYKASSEPVVVLLLPPPPPTLLLRVIEWVEDEQSIVGHSASRLGRRSTGEEENSSMQS